ncbi:hypothetical protein Pelo_10556 [Pelomyxa schiedti]|nr:hypothetical protein Pelo_10556 [Pelomyxa schiedti]
MDSWYHQDVDEADRKAMRRAIESSLVSYGVERQQDIKNHYYDDSSPNFPSRSLKPEQLLSWFKDWLGDSSRTAQLLGLVKHPNFDPNAMFSGKAGSLFLECLRQSRNAVAIALAKTERFSAMEHFYAMMSAAREGEFPVSREVVAAIIKHKKFRSLWSTSLRSPFSMVLKYDLRKAALQIIDIPDFDATKCVDFAKDFGDERSRRVPMLGLTTTNVALKVTSHHTFNPHCCITPGSSITLFEWAITEKWWEVACEMIKHPRFNNVAISTGGDFVGRDFTYIALWHSQTRQTIGVCARRPAALSLLCAQHHRLGVKSPARGLNWDLVALIVHKLWPIDADVWWYKRQ